MVGDASIEFLAAGSNRGKHCRITQAQSRSSIEPLRACLVTGFYLRPAVETFVAFVFPSCGAPLWESQLTSALRTTSGGCDSGTNSGVRDVQMRHWHEGCLLLGR